MPSKWGIIHFPQVVWQPWEDFVGIISLPELWNSSAENTGRELSDLRCQSRKRICYESSSASIQNLLEKTEGGIVGEKKISECPSWHFFKDNLWRSILRFFLTAWKKSNSTVSICLKKVVFYFCRLIQTDEKEDMCP